MARFPHEKLNKIPINIDGQWWEPYTFGQVHAEILVCQHLHAVYQKQGGLDPRWFLPHSATNGSKYDTGKAYPLQDVRDAIFAQMPIDGIPWLKSFQADPEHYAYAIEEEDDSLFLMELEEHHGDLLSWDEVQMIPDPDFQVLIEEGYWKNELDSVRRALKKLGYVKGDFCEGCPYNFLPILGEASCSDKFRNDYFKETMSKKI